MARLALDIGTYSIKALHAKKQKEGVEVMRAVERSNPTGVSIPTEESIMEKMVQELEIMFSDEALPRNDLRLALPESVVSTKVIQIPSLSDAELASAIGWQAEQYIPIPKEELSLEYEVLYRPKRSDKNMLMRVLLIGVKKNIIDSFVTMFTQLGIEPKFLETQTLSIVRALKIADTDPTTMIVHIGYSTMDISVVRKGELAFVLSHPNGGALFTRAIERLLGLSAQQAEEYKRSYGLEQQHLEGKISRAILPVIQSFVSQIQKAMHFYTSEYQGETVQRILLSGGSVQLPGLISYMAQNLGVETLFSNPFEQSSGELPQANMLAFTPCVGLIMRDES